MAMTDQDQAAPQEPVLTSAASTQMVPGTGNNPWRWFFSAIWLVYLIGPVWDLFGHRHGVLWIAGGLAITLAFCFVYIAALVNWGERPAWAGQGLAALAVLAALACVVYGKNWTPLWIYVSAATGMVLAGRAGRTAAGHARGPRRRGLLPALQLARPRGRDRLLRHACCPSCSSAWP